MRKDSFIIIRKYFLQIPPSVIIFIAIQAGFFIVYGKYDESDEKNVFLNIVQLFKTFLTLGIISWLIPIVFSKWRKISYFFQITFLYFYTLLLIYHYHTRTSLDFSIIWDYRKELFYSEVLQMIYNTIGINTLVFLIALTITVLIGQLKWKLFSKPSYSKIKIHLVIIFSLFLWFLYLLPFKSYDEITSFSKSIKNWYRIHYVFSDYTFTNIPQYPYVNNIDTTNAICNNSRLPNIFIIAVESFNADFVEKKAYTGKKITPFFDSLISKGIYIEHFYSNSIETVRGHLSMLFSILPSFRGSVFENFSFINLKSLPQVLKNFNYKTLFYQGANSLNFQNEGPFLTRYGFEICRTANGKTNEDIANWGIKSSGYGGFNDNVLYKQFFETLDSLHICEKDNCKKYFGFLATITSHRPWLSKKYNPDLPYPNAEKIEEDFSNILFRVDSYLRIFFNELKKREYLKNSIVIITGDHSCPANEHGTILNVVNLYDENCKIPFLMLWDNKLEPRRLTKNAWSQIDIAPSIFDLLNIKVKNHFMGKSFFSIKRSERNFVHLVQPYSGLFFAAIVYPYKYVINIIRNEESLYNLSKDPEERNNIIDKFDEEKLNLLKKQIYQFALNQYLIENNRIWPDSLTVDF